MSKRTIEQFIDNPGWNGTWNLDRDDHNRIVYSPETVKMLTDLIAKARVECRKYLDLADQVEKILGERT